MNISPITHSTPVKACGPKRGPVESRWTKAELVAYAVGKGRLAKTQANKMKLENLCSVMRDAGLRIPSHRASSRHSSPRASSRHSSPVKRCGPLRGPNRYTKPELVAFAVSNGMTKSKASKMTVDKLCKFMKSAAYPSPHHGSHHSSPHHGSHHSSSRHSSPRASPRASPHKQCGPKTGPNRWTKPELVDYAVSLGMKKTHAKKMTLNRLCMNVVPSNVHVPMSMSPF